VERQRQKDFKGEIDMTATSRNKAWWTYEDKKAFSIAWSSFLAEWGIRKYVYALFEENIRTEPAAHPKLTEDLIRNALWLTRKNAAGQDEFALMPRTKSRDLLHRNQRIGISVQDRWGTCPKCRKSFKEIVEGFSSRTTNAGPLNQIKYHVESLHVETCDGNEMAVLPLATFLAEEDETLADIANCLKVNVYVLLALNIDTAALRPKATRAIPTICHKGESTLVTVLTPMKNGQNITVPAEDRNVEQRQSDKRPRDDKGKFAGPSNGQQMLPNVPVRHRPEGWKKLDHPKKERFLNSPDNDWSKDEARSKHQRWSPNIVSALCGYVHTARKAASKRNVRKRVAIEKAWKWRYQLSIVFPYHLFLINHINTLNLCFQGFL
jgi:hypothetical protein